MIIWVIYSCTRLTHSLTPIVSPHPQPCAPLVRFIAAIERSLLDRASDNPVGLPPDAASSLAPVLRPKEEYTTAASAAASPVAPSVAPSVAVMSAGAVPRSSTVLLDCIDIGCGHAR